MTLFLLMLSRIVRPLSEANVTRAARGLGRFWWSVIRYRRRVIEDNLMQAFPDLSDRDRSGLGASACVHLVRTSLEFLRIPEYAKTGFEGVVRLEGFENYEAAKRQGKGVLCLSGHMGSFELAVAAVAEKAQPISVVVKRLPPGAEAFITGTRSARSLRLIPAEGAVRPVLTALRRKESVVFVLDQNATRRIGIFVEFFGKLACTMSALAVLAMRTGAPVIGATSHREDDGVHVLRVHPPIPWEGRSTREETIRHMTQVYTRFLEKAIRSHPEQWFWTHKRWRTRPKEG